MIFCGNILTYKHSGASLAQNFVLLHILHCTREKHLCFGERICAKQIELRIKLHATYSNSLLVEVLLAPYFFTIVLKIK